MKYCLLDMYSMVIREGANITDLIDGEGFDLTHLTRLGWVSYLGDTFLLNYDFDGVKSPSYKYVLELIIKCKLQTFLFDN